MKIPSPQNYRRKVWHFKRANPELIARALNNIDWESNFLLLNNPTDQVDFLNKHVLNVLSNFIPNEYKKFSPSKPPWIDNKIKSLFRKQNELYRKFVKNGYEPEDKDILDRHRISCSVSVL